LKEKKKWKAENKLTTFIPNKAQRPFYESEAKVHAFLAANKIGKTTVCVVKMLNFLIEKPRVYRVITGLSYGSGIRDIIVPEVMKWCPPSRIIESRKNSDGAIISMKIKASGGSSSLTFMSADQDDLAFEGAVLDGAWIDEPVRQGIYTATLRGLLTTGGKLMMSLTPLEEPWIYNDIFLKSKSTPHIECFQGSMYDATKENGGHLTLDDINTFISTIPKDEIGPRVRGEFRHLLGRVYKEYNEEVHVIDPFYIPPHWPVYCAIDPHQRKPNVALFVAVSPDEKLYVCNEIFMPSNIEDFGEEVLAVGRQYNWVKTVIDTSSETLDWHRKETARTMLTKIGLDTTLARKHNQKEAARIKVKLLLEGRQDGKPDLYIFRNCKRIRHEFMNYVWNNHKDPASQGVKEEPKKVNDDALDCLHYIVVENPKHNKSEILKCF